LRAFEQFTVFVGEFLGKKKRPSNDEGQEEVGGEISLIAAKGGR
jgi:hypothetical protein